MLFYEGRVTFSDRNVQTRIVISPTSERSLRFQESLDCEAFENDFSGTHKVLMGIFLQLKSEKRLYYGVSCIPGIFTLALCGLRWSFLFCNRFPDHPTSSPDEMHRVDYSVGGTIITAEILDTSGYASFPAMQEVAIRQADAFLLVFDSDDSFECVKNIKDEIIRIKKVEQRCSILPMTAVCTKMDIPLAERTLDVNYAEFLVCQHGYGSILWVSGDRDAYRESARRVFLEQHISSTASAAVNPRRHAEPRERYSRHSVAGFYINEEIYWLYLRKLQSAVILSDSTLLVVEYFLAGLQCERVVLCFT